MKRKSRSQTRRIKSQKGRTVLQKHQFKRFSCKGGITRTRTIFEAMSQDCNDYTIIEQMSAGHIVQACDALLNNWKNKLPGVS